MNKKNTTTGSRLVSRSGKASVDTALALKQLFASFCCFIQGAKVARVKYLPLRPSFSNAPSKQNNIRKAMSGGSKGRSSSHFLFHPSRPSATSLIAGCNIAVLMLNCPSQNIAHGAKEKEAKSCFKASLGWQFRWTGRLTALLLMPLNYSFAEKVASPCRHRTGKIKHLRCAVDDFLTLIPRFFAEASQKFPLFDDIATVLIRC